MCLGGIDCFEQSDLERHGLASPPDQGFSLLTTRPTLYGPGVNQSSYEHVAKHYVHGFTVIAKTMNDIETSFQRIAAVSDFSGNSFCILHFLLTVLVALALC